MVIVDTIDNLHRYATLDIVDITCKHINNKYSKLSPFYRHGDIPIPNTPKVYASSVYDVWRKLRIKSEISSKGIYKIFKKGLYSTEYWGLVEARHKILIPIYCWMLENKVYHIIEFLRKKLTTDSIVIIDSSTNDMIDNIEEPFSCGNLLKAYIEGFGPYKNAIKDSDVERCIMIGRKYYYKKERIKVYQKIARINTDIQGEIDF